jgi:hypothetical protein
VVGQGVPTGMAIRTDYPPEVGADLITALAGRQRDVRHARIVIGFGTATTFTAISAAGELEGVAIAPGVITGQSRSSRSTAQLPQVALNRPARAIGKNTINSIQAGLVFGYAGLVEGVVARIKAELGGHAHVVATGGLAELIAAEAPCIEAVEPGPDAHRAAPDLGREPVVTRAQSLAVQLLLPLFRRAGRVHAVPRAVLPGDRGLSGAQIGVLTSIFPLVTLLAAPLWTGLADALADSPAAHGAVDCRRRVARAAV